MINAWVLAIVMAAAVVAGSAFARADHRPSIVVPGRPDVPVIINGRDASYAVAEGDWGLYRPGHATLEIYGSEFGPPPYQSGGYFPRTGRRPLYGRREVLPVTPWPPAPAQSFRRFWGGGGEPAPITAYPPFDPPAVIVAPRRQRPRSPTVIEARPPEQTE